MQGIILTNTYLVTISQFAHYCIGRSLNYYRLFYKNIRRIVFETVHKMLESKQRTDTRTWFFVAAGTSPCPTLEILRRTAEANT